MKNIKPTISIALIALILLSFNFTSCVVNSHSTYVKSKPLPPGQAKKVYGDKSAKNYAPGQIKKN
jgi:hypothetical protein